MSVAARGIAVLLLAAGMPTLAADAERGRRLHDEQCTRCHDAGMYTRQQRIVKSYAALRERVQQCELAAELMWFEEDVDDVAAYLDREFYHFADEPEK